MQQTYRRTPISHCGFNKVALQLYSNHTSAWVFSCKFAAYLQNTFLWEHSLNGCFWINNIHRSKLYHWHAHLQKTFLQLLLLKVCETFIFRQSKKLCSILWSIWVFFAFLEKRRSNRYCLWEVNLVFHT